MSLLERVIRAHRCRSTHHFIALDAMALIDLENQEAWKRLFLVHHEHLLAGAKAPDAKFKDFQNHVLHVSEGRWGGAPGKAMEWYARAVELLARKKWSEAAFAFGVLSHYYADPIQPFHTGQTEEEGVIHRAVEWSIAKSRAEIDELIAARGYPTVEAPTGQGFVADMVVAGAELSHVHYQTLIDHYNLDAGVIDPPAGLDATLRDVIADLVAYATAGFATLMTCAIEEAAVAPPKVNLTIQGYIETLDIPLRWVTAKLSDVADRRQVEKMYAEFQKTGKVVKTLPDDDKAIRRLHAQQVLRVPLKKLDQQPVDEIGTKHVPDDGRVITVPAKTVAKLAAKKEEPRETVIIAPPAIVTAKPDKASKKQARADAKAAKAKAKADAKAQAEEAKIAKAADAAAAKTATAEAKAIKIVVPPPQSKAILVAEPEDIRDSDEDVIDEEALAEAEEDENTAVEDMADIETDADEEMEFDAEEEALLEELAALEAAELEAAEAEAADEDTDSHRAAAAYDAERASPSGRRPSLRREDPLVEAPSIGKKTAKRLAREGLTTVADLVDCDAEETAYLLDISYIDAETLTNWQDQAKLMMSVPGLRGHDAQVLVGAGIRTSEDLANASARSLFLMAMEFLSSPEGEGIQRDDEFLVEDEVEEWIGLAQEAA